MNQQLQQALPTGEASPAHAGSGMRSSRQRRASCNRCPGCTACTPASPGASARSGAPAYAYSATTPSIAASPSPASPPSASPPGACPPSAPKPPLVLAPSATHATKASAAAAASSAGASSSSSRMASSVGEMRSPPPAPSASAASCCCRLPRLTCGSGAAAGAGGVAKPVHRHAAWLGSEHASCHAARSAACCQQAPFARFQASKPRLRSPCMHTCMLCAGHARTVAPRATLRQSSSAASGTSIESNTMSQPWNTDRLFSSRPGGRGVGDGEKVAWGGGGYGTPAAAQQGRQAAVPASCAKPQRMCTARPAPPAAYSRQQPRQAAQTAHPWRRPRQTGPRSCGTAGPRQRPGRTS